MKILDSITCSDDVKRMSHVQQAALCADLREYIFQTVAENGGHLASNLGVIELTVALQCVFDSSKDRIVWDVGHQCYAHKILTGRKDSFATIRQYQGLSGFPKYRESIHDAFDTGHASTSISAALGLARARDLLHQPHKIIAVVGDGALTGGMCYEALNDAGQSKTDILVILNDNAMAISKSVGGMTTYLSKLRASPGYLHFKRRIKKTLSSIPGIGKGLFRFAERVRDRVKFFMLPRVFFEEIGFTYLGPIDGHDLPMLIEVLEDIKNFEQPVFLHLMTTKGRGFGPAEEDPEQYHGLGAHNNGSAPVTLPSNGTLVCRTLCDMAKNDQRIVAITAAMTTGTGLPWFAKEYPERFFDVAIAEQHAVTMAAGMARGGMRPVVAIYSTFLQRAYDQILHDVCLANLPVIFCIDRAGLVGADGETHHGAFDMAMMMPMPNIRLYSPCNQSDLVLSLHEAMQFDGPSAIRYPRGTLPLAAEPGFNCDEWRTVSPYTDITLLATGRLSTLAKSALDQLNEQGISVGYVEACRIKPLDEPTLFDIAKHSKHVITLEEGCIIGGFGASVTQWAARNPSFRVHTLGLPDRFIEHGENTELMESIGLTRQSVVDLVLQFKEKSNA